MRRAARVDDNMSAIVEALEAANYPTVSLAPLGRGVPDLLVRCPDDCLLLLEVKRGRGKLTAAQEEFHRRWPVAVVRNVTEAFSAVGLRVTPRIAAADPPDEILHHTGGLAGTGGKP